MNNEERFQRSLDPNRPLFSKGQMEIWAREIWINRKKKEAARGLGKEGFCLICGELDSRFLILHHIFGKKINFVLSLCANCHRKYLTPSRNHYIWILRAIENGVMFK